MSKKSTLYLVDGSSYLYRAFHAMPNLTNSHGEPTGALLGVANMIRRLLNEESPEHIAVVFDARGPTFRHEMYPEYKANRPPMPAELRQQVEPILEFVRLLGLPLLQIEGVEADDVIGTLSRQAEEAGLDCVISTGDKDMAQLVSKHTTLTNTMTDTRTDRDGVVDTFGVQPEQFIDFLALTGDASDNIPGVEKCGPKTAAKWLNAWGDLDSVIAHADEVGGKIGENLRAALEQLPLSRELARIRRDIELEAAPKTLLRNEGDRAGLVEATRGAEGGYRLARPAETISAAEIVDVLEGPVAITECSTHDSQCELESLCVVGDAWQQINQAILRALQDVSLADLSRPAQRYANTAVNLPAGIAPGRPAGSRNAT